MSIDSLPGTFSLSLAGLHVFDGLHIIFEREDLPKTVFIETNMFFFPENKSFTSLFDSKMKNVLKKNLSILQESNQPVGIAKYYISALFHKQRRPEALKNEIPIPMNVYSQLLAEKQRQYSSIDTAEIGEALDKLQEEVKMITSRGSKVCFFKMPISPELDTLPEPEYVSMAIRQRFDTMSNIRFMGAPARKDLKTSDGIHLNEYSAREYTQYFREQMVE
jgi:hypothetical protein